MLPVPVILNLISKAPAVANVGNVIIKLSPMVIPAVVKVLNHKRTLDQEIVLAIIKSAEKMGIALTLIIPLARLLWNAKKAKAEVRGNKLVIEKE